MSYAQDGSPDQRQSQNVSHFSRLAFHDKREVQGVVGVPQETIYSSLGLEWRSEVVPRKEYQ